MTVPAQTFEATPTDRGGELIDDTLGEQDFRKRIANIVLQVRHACGVRRWAVDRNTFLNEAFDKDAQYVEWDPSRRVVLSLPAPRASIRRTINLMKPYNRTQESRLLRGQPSYQCSADGDDPLAEDAAELANDLIPWIEKIINIRKVRQKIAFWIQRAGTAVLWPLWDFEGGPMVQDAGGQPLPAGQPFIDVSPPHETFYYPLSATDMDSAEGIGRDVRIGRAEAIVAFPELKDKLAMPQGDDDRSSSRLTRAIRDFPAGQSGWLGQAATLGLWGADADDDGSEDEALLIEFYLERGGALIDIGGNEVMLFPNGLRLVCTPIGEIAHWGPNVYGGLPAVRVGFSESAGFWSPSPCTPLRPIQMAINWAYSLWEEHLVLAGRPVMLWPTQAKAAWRRLQDLTTKILQFRAGPKGQVPAYMDPPTFPSGLKEILDFLIAMWRDVSGVHEVSQGQLPSASISGVAIQLLQDQDDSQIAFVIGEIESGLAKMMEMQLENIRHFVDVEILAQGLGNSPHQARTFKGTDLARGVRVMITPGSAFPKSPAALEAKAKEAWLGGYLLDEFGMPDWRRAQVIMGLGAEDHLFDEMQQDKNNAAAEEEALLRMNPDEVQLVLAFTKFTGMLPEEFLPRRYDDHIVHEQRHKRRLKEARERMAMGDQAVSPAHLMLLELHWEMHQLPALQQRMGLMGQLGGFGAATGEVNPQGQPGAGPQDGSKAATQRRGLPTPA